MGFSLGSAIKGAVTGFAASGGNPWGAVVGAGVGALDAQTAKSAYKWEQKQNIRLWNMQNEYNSPKAQMQRYIDAGLNPNLIYSQQNTAGDIASASSLNQKQETLGGAINSMQARQQLLNMESSRQQQLAQTLSIYEQIEKVRNDVKYQQEMMPYQQALMKAQAENLIATANSPEWLSKFVGKKNADRIVSALDGNKPAEKNPGFTLFKYKGESYGF